MRSLALGIRENNDIQVQKREDGKAHQLACLHVVENESSGLSS